MTNKVYCMDCLKLLRALPAESVDSCIADPMYGVMKTPYPYDSIVDDFKGDAGKWWSYHQPIYEEVRRVLRPGGTFCWAQAYKFHQHFGEWFGGYLTWGLTKYLPQNFNVFGHIWIVQTREQEGIRFPAKNCLIPVGYKDKALKNLHPCPKTVEEMIWLVEALTKPNDVVLDPFCGIGTTLIAAKQTGRRWIGCDLSRRYCQTALWRLNQV